MGDTEDDVKIRTMRYNRRYRKRHKRNQRILREQITDFRALTERRGQRDFLFQRFSRICGKGRFFGPYIKARHIPADMRENMRIVFASDDSERGDTPALQNLFGRRPFLRDVRRELVHALQYPFFAAPDGDARRSGQRNGLPHQRTARS